ncbi:OsmC family peroxiredoxin [Allorhodopirellula solitaria]|uniref:Peroxiredoxin OsmC n=1 Tax=Allorhodopirellula solitaria TaxID=2527987 RepID=A0A5C5XPT1_9BACT|nr:OsmC family peroxiredoxin [Allorhodopirellula solitaria]TWT64884.1 Peroxiredoxin OsmC [Allorhodopirellula solitaria]
MQSKAAAVWRGGLNEGHGSLSGDNETFAGMPFTSNFRNQTSGTTNPEELLAAAHASCFSLTLSMILSGDEFAVGKIETEATVTLEKTPGGLAITRSHLIVHAIVPGASPERFVEAAKQAEKDCPISKLIQGGVTMEAHLLDIG